MTAAKIGPFEGNSGALVSAAIVMLFAQGEQRKAAAEAAAMVKYHLSNREVSKLLDQAVAFAQDGEYGENKPEPPPPDTTMPRVVQPVFTVDEFKVLDVLVLVGMSEINILFNSEASTALKPVILAFALQALESVPNEARVSTTRKIRELAESMKS